MPAAHSRLLQLTLCRASGVQTLLRLTTGWSAIVSQPVTESLLPYLQLGSELSDHVPVDLRQETLSYAIVVER